MRFDTKGHKINRKIDYPTQLSVAEYHHEEQHKDTRSTAIYNLCVVIVHEGNEISSSHYICYAKRNGRWFYTSDTVVKESSTLVAHNINAYMLFYERKIEQRELENVSKPNGISPSNTENTYASTVKRGSPFCTTSAIKLLPKIYHSTPANNKSIPVQSHSRNKKRATTFLPPSISCSSKSNQSQISSPRLPHTNKEENSFTPLHVRPTSKIAKLSLRMLTPAQVQLNTNLSESKSNPGKFPTTVKR